MEQFRLVRTQQLNDFKQSEQPVSILRHTQQGNPQRFDGLFPIITMARVQGQHYRLILTLVQICQPKVKLAFRAANNQLTSNNRNRYWCSHPLILRRLPDDKVLMVRRRAGF